MATTSFIANVNKTVTIDGILYTLSVPSLPDGAHLYINEVELVAGETVTLDADMVLTMTVEPISSSTIEVSATNYNTLKFNDVDIISPAVLTIPPGDNTLEFIGATSIPSVTVNGSGINTFSVNSGSFPGTDLPYTFVPQGGIVNNIFMDGSALESQTITIAGTDIETMTVNNIPVNLPYTTLVSEPLQIAVAGKIYQLDIESVGGAKIKADGTIISDGNSTLHRILDVDHDTFIELDGTHILTVNGENIENISFNGVIIPITSLPFNVSNNKMTASLTVNGFKPSEVHLVGNYIRTATVDGSNIPIGVNGSLEYELTTVKQNHFITVIGAQPVPWNISFNDNGSTSIFMDGVRQTSGTVVAISKDVFIEALPEDIPVHFESPSNITVQINGRRYHENDFTFMVNQQTEVDISTETCELTIDYGDNSFSLTVPQAIVSVTAPHRDFWIFDGWSSPNVGVNNPKSVQTTLDLRQRSVATLIAHYQRHVTHNKPNMFN